jgi:hypothetical protein
VPGWAAAVCGSEEQQAAAGRVQSQAEGPGFADQVGDQWPAGGRRGQQRIERLVKLRAIGDVKTQANLGTDCYKIVPYS